MATEPDFRSLQRALAAHLREPGQPLPLALEPRRLALYRTLVLNNISSFINSSFPVSRSIVAEGWQPLIQQFVAQYACSSPLFLDIPAQFLQFFSGSYPQGLAGKAFLPELLHYEWMELAVATRPASPLARWTAADDAPLCLYGAAEPLSYCYPVHRLSPDYQPTLPPEMATTLLIYRDRDDEVRFMAISPLLATALSLLGRHAQGMTFARWLEALALAQADWPAALLADGLRAALPSLLERGIVGGVGPECCIRSE